MANNNLLIGWRLRWNRTLLLFLRQRVRTSVDIEDIAQETYLRLLRARDLSDVRNPQAYLLKTASHVVAEWRDRAHAAGVAIADDEQILVDECTPELELDAHISENRLNETLASFSAMMRAVLLLRLRDECPYKEIARVLGLTDRQVKRYLARGYERLRRTVEE